MDKQKFIKENLFVFICAAITFAGVLSTAVIFKQDPVKTLPLFISLFVMFLNSRVSRYAFLVGGLNSILYALSGIKMGLYAHAVYCVLFSFPLQIITFINWKRKTSGGITHLRKMSTKMRLIVLLAFLVIWPIVYFVISSIPDANQSILDVTGTLLGILVTFLTMLRYSEYAPLNIVSAVISLATYIMVSVGDISNFPYVIYTLYCLVCITASMIRMKKENMVK